MTGAPLPPYRVAAYNTARHAENKIHDDVVASRFGFRGGLVPGVDVYAYMTHPAVERWGRAWLERGAAECRFVKPVYDGDVAEIGATESAEGLALTVHSRGELCATGIAALPETLATPAPSDYRAAPPAAERPPADERSLAEGTRLGIAPLAVTPDVAARYLADVRETAALYARDGLVHPGLLPRLCNGTLTQNVVLGPWIHVGNRIRHLSAALVGDTLTVRARVAGNFERKGNRFVELDALVLANGERPVAQIVHTAIYRPRVVAESG